jgi:hypothetical protein
VFLWVSYCSQNDNFLQNINQLIFVMELCSLCGKNPLFKCYLDEVRLQGVNIYTLSQHMAHFWKAFQMLQFVKVLSEYVGYLWCCESVVKSENWGTGVRDPAAGILCCISSDCQTSYSHLHGRNMAVLSGHAFAFRKSHAINPAPCCIICVVSGVVNATVPVTPLGAQGLYGGSPSDSVICHSP